MRSFFFALAIVACACGSARTTAPPPAVEAKPTVDGHRIVETRPPSPAVPRVSKRGRIDAPHGGTIVALGVTPDATAAISADELGGVRLWPTLDGTAEPRVVDLPRPKSLALAREPRGFVIAMIDEVGGLILQVIDRDGLSIQRAALGIDPAHVGVAVIERPRKDHAIVAWRADHRVLLLGFDGSVIAELAAPPGQRIVAMAAAGGHAVAVLEDASAPSKRRPRELVVTEKLAWGSDLGGTDELTGPIAISPSGKRLAYVTMTKNVPNVVVIDTRDQKMLALELIGPAPFALPDDDHLAYAVAGSVQWIELAVTTNKPRIVRNSVPTERSLLGAGAGRAITATSGELVITTAAKVEYLGYDLQSPAVAAAAPAGKLLIGLGDAFALLDGKLEAGPAPDLMVPPGSAIADLRWLAGDDWLVETSRINDGLTSVSLVDTTKHRAYQIRAGMTMVQMLMADPSTQLVTLSLGEQPEVFHHEPGKLKLDRVATLPKPDGFERTQLVPVAPRLAGGVQLVVVHMKDHLTLRWVKDPRALDKGTAITLDGSLAGVDATGTAYIWQNDVAGVLELATVRDGKRVGTLPTDGPTAIWPDPKGTFVLAVGQHSIALVESPGMAGPRSDAQPRGGEGEADGKRKWTQALQGVTEALWLDDGTIGIVSAAGIARLDAKTGELVAARCGWRFGLSSKQHPASPRVDPVCAQMR